MEESIFTKIIKGEIPSHKVYEDEKTFAFLDIHPIQPGMTLVITRTPATTFLDLEAEDHAALWATVQKVAKQLKQTFPDKKRIGVQVEGLDVPHVHVKLIPINSADEFRTMPNMSAEPDHDELAKVAEKIRNSF
jgi:histidine triad (HIT) family protein